MLKTIFLDVDDTILDFHKAESAAIRRTLETLGIDPAPETTALYSRINAQQWELLEEGRLTRPQVLTRRFDLLFGELGIERSSCEAQKTYERLLSQGHWFMPGAEALLETLFGRYDLYIVSNGTGTVQDGRIASAGIARYFRDIFISERIGFDKPRREFFDACFARIPDFDRSRAIIVGDSLTSDIRGGINAGILTCWYNPRGKQRREDIVPDLEISALMQLPPLLEGI